MRKLTYIIILALSLIAASCKDKAGTRQRTITVSIEPLRFLTEQIAGDRFDVAVVVRQGGSPETYEPTAKQLTELAHSDLYIKVGELGFERTWLKRIMQNAPHTIIVDASEGIKRELSINGIPDPHVWMSASNAIAMANNIYNKLIEIDQKDSALFKENLRALTERLRKADTAVRANITRDKTKAFIIYHPALTYFARDYGLTQIPIEEEGREPSAAQLKDVISKGKEENVKILFVQEEFSNRNIDIIKNSLNVEAVAINPLSYHLDEEMIRISKLLQ